MMSSMPTSRKRTKYHIAKFLGAILGICLLSACGGQNAVPSDPTTRPQVQTVPDATEWINKKITVSSASALYRKDENGSFSEIGTAETSGYYDIAEAEGRYLRIADSRFYLNADDAVDSNRWFRNKTNLQPVADQQIRTASVYHLQDEKGHPFAEIRQSDVYDIYVIPSEDDPRYGVRFQNAVCFIPETEISARVLEREAYSPVSNASQVSVLMYHFFYDESKGETRSSGNFVEVNELREQLSWIQNNGYASLTMHELLYYMQGRAAVPADSVVLTIDDGDPSVYTYAYPVFREFGMNAVNFLITGWEEPQMSWDRWEMREEGMELQSHGFLVHVGGCSGMGHGGLLMCMDYDEAVADTVRSLEYVDGGIAYCYPFGDYNDRAKQIMRDAGVKMAFTTEPGKIHPGMDMYALPRVRVHGGNSLGQFASSISN